MTKWYSKWNVFKAGLSSEDVNIVQEYEDEINFYYVNLSTWNYIIKRISSKYQEDFMCIKCT